MELDLSEALGGDEPGGPPGNYQPSNPMFGGGQGQPSNPMFGGGQGQPSNPMFGGGQGQPSNPMFGGGQGQPSNPMFDGGQGQPSNPMFSGGQGQPSNPMFGGGPWPTDNSRGGGPKTSSTSNVQQNMTTPYEMELRSGVYEQLLITITGRINADAKHFTVDLCSGQNIAFHFNSRFNEGGREVVVRNSCISQKWGTEERTLQSFPFRRGENFELKILCTKDDFRVAVDGHHLLSFRHRIKDLKNIKKLGIYYDILIHSVNQDKLR